MEKCRNEANRSGVCRCQIRAYDKNAERPARPLLADETSGTLLFPTKRPSSAGESESCRSSHWSHKVGDLFRAFPEPRRSAVPFSGVVTGPPAGVGGGLGPSLAAYNSALLGLFLDELRPPLFREWIPNPMHCQHFLSSLGAFLAA